ncbi:MAG TPA: helix-turn-helix transcriptional regulator [Trebonia sp.]|jgi:transcriptional regulator with XRE-family HTH domain|nr:helix-turn-helix transcriptional regulator [Trebonia sp.]
MGVRPRRRLGAPLKRETAAALVRKRVADGSLKLGGAAPSAAALARETGYSTLTCRAALKTLVKDRTLARGLSPTARLRVAQPPGGVAGEADLLRVALSKALSGHRRAAGMTQPELAEKLGVSLTTVGHAETGRLWQSRDFWLRADLELGGAGELLGMFDRYKAAQCAPPEEADDAAPEEAAPDTHAGPVLPASVTITADGVLVTWPDGTETVARPPGYQREPQAGQSGE